MYHPTRAVFGGEELGNFAEGDGCLGLWGFSVFTDDSSARLWPWLAWHGSSALGCFHDRDIPTMPLQSFIPPCFCLVSFSDSNFRSSVVLWHFKCIVVAIWELLLLVCVFWFFFWLMYLILPDKPSPGYLVLALSIGKSRVRTVKAAW